MSGLDISPGGTAYALLKASAGAVGGFYTVSLASGAATLVGTIGGAAPVRDIAVAITTPTSGETVYAVTTDNRLERFGSLLPGTILGNFQIGGLAVGESLVGIDFRPGPEPVRRLEQREPVYLLNRRRSHGGGRLERAFTATGNRNSGST